MIQRKDEEIKELKRIIESQEQKIKELFNEDQKNSYKV